jgi:hypothetical protein
MSDVDKSRPDVVRVEGDKTPAMRDGVLALWGARPAVAHLFLGTALDNMLDKERKGRGRNQYHGATHCKRGHPRIPTEIQCLACRRVTAEIRRANGGKW